MPSSSGENNNKVIILKSSDGETFEVEEVVALESQTIKHMIEDNCADSSIPLPNVTSKILVKVIEYCKRQVAAAAAKANDGAYMTLDNTPDNDLKAFNEKFLKDVDDDQEALFDLILAANYLDIKSLLDLTCEHVAEMFKRKSPEEIRKHFNIKNDYTAAEEEEVRRENAWAFE